MHATTQSRDEAGASKQSLLVLSIIFIITISLVLLLLLFLPS